MYYLYREKNIMPGDYYKMSPGEKLILRAFFEKDCGIFEFERRKRALEAKG